MQVQQYLSERLKDMKSQFRALRKEARYSQQAVADLLGCTRSRIMDIEDQDSSTFYTIGEIELLAAVFGRYPLDVLRMTQQDALDLARILTARQTRDALASCVDCALPPRLQQLYTNQHHLPGNLEFSPGGAVLASVVDHFVAQDWDDWQVGTPPSLTVMCWDASTGEIRGQTQLPHVEHIAVLDEERVAIATSRPLQKVHDMRYYEGEYHLLIWNARSDTIEREVQILGRVGDLAVSPDGAYLAAYFPTTTTIQVWRTSDFTAAHAFELETPRDDVSSLSISRFASRVQQLPRKRKFGPWMGDYSAERFEFMRGNILIFSWQGHMHEFGMGTIDGHVRSEIQYPHMPFRRVVHDRNEQREIAVTAIDYNSSTGESQVELYYLIPGESGRGTHAQMVRRYLGHIGQPIIVDEGCVLAQVNYKTSHQWGVWPKDLLGLVNLVTGRIVMLDDRGRLRDEDFPIVARIAPAGDRVAYWVYPQDKRTPARLVVQFIDTAPLQVKGVTLAAELDRSRKRRVVAQMAE